MGKTCLVSRFLGGKFQESYTPTIEDFHRKLYRIRGEIYQLDILDTSGNHPFPAMRRLSFLTGGLFCRSYSIFLLLLNEFNWILCGCTTKNSSERIYSRAENSVDTTLFPGDLFVIVFSMDSRETFEEAIRLREQILETKINAGASSSGGGLTRKRTAPRVPMILAGNKSDKEMK